ncbi:transcription factor HES-7.1-A [Folsomia candida]|uniref:Enhancer of split mgamma protein n=1 Tax=Folsomia candida TaxID=158441 RepID=A0A226EMB3_FOLCA|nr:transcription factor HES-7.1-A [Folsomia candida]OXA58599.1 Enhancer of split mgamma protein [Folsomia candida]
MTATSPAMPPSVKSRVTHENTRTARKATSGRKVIKGLIERRRRARINQSLSILKDLVVDKESREEKVLKLEKADILTLTISYLQKLNQEKELNHRHLCFNDGYKECFRTVVKYLETWSFPKSTIKELVLSISPSSFANNSHGDTCGSNSETTHVSEPTHHQDQIHSHGIFTCLDDFSNEQGSGFFSPSFEPDPQPLDLSQFGNHSKFDRDSLWRPWTYHIPGLSKITGSGETWPVQCTI